MDPFAVMDGVDGAEPLDTVEGDDVAIQLPEVTVTL